MRVICQSLEQSSCSIVPTEATTRNHYLCLKPRGHLGTVSTKRPSHRWQHRYLIFHARLCQCTDRFAAIDQESNQRLDSRICKSPGALLHSGGGAHLGVEESPKPALLSSIILAVNGSRERRMWHTSSDPCGSLVSCVSYISTISICMGRKVRLIWSVVCENVASSCDKPTCLLDRNLHQAWSRCAMARISVFPAPR